MAKKAPRNARKPKRRNASLERLVHLEAIRNLALTMERRAAEAYMTRPDSFDVINDMVLTLIKALRVMNTPIVPPRPGPGQGGPPDPCDYPFVLCGDGRCRREPDCS